MGSRDGFGSIEYFLAADIPPSCILSFQVLGGPTNKEETAECEKLSKETPKELSIAQFEQLCYLCYSDKYIGEAILLVYDSAKASLDVRLHILAIVMEMLKNSDAVKSQSPKKPIQSDSLWNEIRKKLLEVVKQHKGKDVIDFDIIKNRINTLNHPTNSDMLLAPFDKFGIELNDEEKKMIKKRNDLLHGFVDQGLEGYDIKLYRKVMKESMIYYHLIYCLILKIIGYNGVIKHIRALEHIQKITNENIPDKYINLE